MNEDGKQEALADWHKLMNSHEPRMEAEELYGKLLALADRYRSIGLINELEWKGLVGEAAAFYVKAREGLEGGT